MLIYFNGDSFTAGNELADDLLPGHPGYRDKEISYEYERKQDHFRSIIKFYDNRFVNYDSCRQDDIESIEFLKYNIEGTLQFDSVKEIIEKNRAWPRYLEKINSNIKTINACRGGAGITGICYRTILDVGKLKAEGKHVDLVVITLTSPERQEIFTKEHVNLMYERPVSQDGHWIRPEDFEVAKAHILRYSRDEWYIKYLWNLSILNHSILGITGKYPILIDSQFDNAAYIPCIINNMQQMENEFLLNDLYDLIEQSRIKESHATFMENIAQNNKNSYCVFGHYAPYIHEKIAKQFYEKILKEYL